MVTWNLPVALVLDSPCSTVFLTLDLYPVVNDVEVVHPEVSHCEGPQTTSRQSHLTVVFPTLHVVEVRVHVQVVLEQVHVTSPVWPCTVQQLLLHTLYNTVKVGLQGAQGRLVSSRLRRAGGDSGVVQEQEEVRGNVVAG